MRRVPPVRRSPPWRAFRRSIVVLSLQAPFNSVACGRLLSIRSPELALVNAVNASPLSMPPHAFVADSHPTHTGLRRTKLEPYCAPAWMLLRAPTASAPRLLLLPEVRSGNRLSAPSGALGMLLVRMSIGPEGPLQTNSALLFCPSLRLRLVGSCSAICGNAVLLECCWICTLARLSLS